MQKIFRSFSLTLLFLTFAAFSLARAATPDETQSQEHERAALAGDIKGQCALGVDFMQGRGRGQNYDEGIKWLSAAADAGDPRGQAWIALVLQGSPDELQQRQAFDMAKAAAEAGHPWAQTLYASMNARGLTKSSDTAAAVEWFRRAANQGEKNAMYNLAIASLKGINGAQDPAVGYFWLTQAANRGFAPAIKARENMTGGLERDAKAAADDLAKKWTPKLEKPAVFDAGDVEIPKITPAKKS